MDNDAAPGGQAEPSEQQQADVNTSLDLSASVNAAVAFVGFQETITLIEQELHNINETEINTLTDGYTKLKHMLTELRQRVDNMTGAIGADNPNFQTEVRTTADVTSLSE